MTRFFLVFIAFILTGCLDGRTEKQIDFASRSTVYGWLDVGDMGVLKGRRLVSMIMRQNQPATDMPFYHMTFYKFNGGYIFSQNGFKNGFMQLHKVGIQPCPSIICERQVGEYKFRRQDRGSGAVRINRPGVYFLGYFRVGDGTFDSIRPGTTSVPSRKQLLGFLVETKPSRKHEAIGRHLRDAFNRL